MKYLCKYLILCTVIASVSCSKTVPDTTGDISGMVTDARTNEPLSGVGITALSAGQSVTTDANGLYSIKKVQASTYTVQAKKSGYKTDEKTVTVSVGRESRLDFQLTPSTANLVVSKNSFDFGNNATSHGLDISNNGSAALNWSITEDASWLSCSPTSGTVHAGEKAATIITVDRSNLDRGNYSQVIVVSSNGGSIDIHVSMSVQGITITATPDQLDFGSTATELPLTLKNSASGSIRYSIASSNDWLKTDKNQGTLSQSEQIMVSVERSGMSEGDYSGSLTITADDNQLEIPVRMSIPSKDKPLVSLNAVTGVSYSEASFSGAITSIGSSNVINHGFCWSTSDSPTKDNAETTNFGDCSEAKDFSYKATGLKESTTYYVRAYAENLEGISYSNQEKFVTAGKPGQPTVKTGTASNITATKASVKGEITNMGNVESISQYGHVWSTKSNPTVSDSKVDHGATWSTGAFTSTLTGLTPRVTYHVRAYATNSVGTSYGEDIEFTTDYGTVTLTTAEATDIRSREATLSATIADKGGHTIAEAGFCWATRPSPTVNDNKAFATVANTFTAKLIGLSPQTEYHVRAYVKTQTGDIFYGNAVSFYTPSREVDINIGDYNGDEYWKK